MHIDIYKEKHTDAHTYTYIHTHTIHFPDTQIQRQVQARALTDTKIDIGTRHLAHMHTFLCT